MHQQRPVGLARRLWPALAIATASSGVLVALDHPAQTGSIGSGAPAAAAANASPRGVTSGRPPAAASPNQLPSSSVSARAQANPTGSTSAPATSAATPTAGGSSCNGTVKDGAEENTRFGIVQVEATVSASGQICAVDAIQTPNDRRRSININQQAVPILDGRAIAAQGTNFQTVSGATVTTGGYKASLQSILDGH